MDDMAGLHSTGVSRFARAHDCIDAIVDQVQQLIKTGHRLEGPQARRAERTAVRAA